MNNPLFFVDNIELLQNNLSALQDAAAKGTKIIPLSDLAYEWLIKKGFHCPNFHEYEYPGIYDSIMSTAQNYGCQWYKSGPKGEDFTIFEGISAGFLIERTMIYYLMDTLKTLSILEEIITKEKPDKILLFDGIKDKARFYADIPTIKRIVNLLSHDSKIEYINASCGVSAKKTFLPIPKEFIRTFLSYINFGFNALRNKQSNTKKIIFYEGFHHVKTTFSALRPYKNNLVVHLQDKFSPMTYPFIAENNAIIEDLERYTVKKSEKTFSCDAEKIEAILKDFFIFKGKSFFPVIRERIEYILKDHIPNVVVFDILRCQNYISKSKPSVVVVENDSVYKERLIVVVSKNYGAKTVVIQHGISLGGTSGFNKDFFCADFYPVTADKFLAWGEFTKDWLEKKGAKPGSVILTGSSRFDDYYTKENSGNLEELKSRINPEGKSIALVILSEFCKRHYIPKYHYNLHEAKQQLKEIIKIARNNNNILFIIRPHSSDDFTLDVLRSIVDSTDIKNVMIDRSMNLHKLLKITDVCVGLYSTVLAEAMVCGIPVVIMNFDQRPEVTPYSEFNLSKTANSPQELESILQKLLNYPASLKHELKEQIKNNIDVINYKHDGKATERIAEYLSNI